MTPLERGYILDLIQEEMDKKRQFNEELRQKSKRGGG